MGKGRLALGALRVFQQERTESCEFKEAVMADCARADCPGCGMWGETQPCRRCSRSRGRLLYPAVMRLCPALFLPSSHFGISVAEGMGAPVTVTTGPQTVDFAKLNGLHTLLDLNTIPAGTYDTVIVTLASPRSTTSM
jgi:hypothetical protein